ncbi:MAG TPA: 30S ribosomal protein S16 [Fredinandcohnia sp.]|nr:30S ribosomal protein S16 [Fredinandcohnia sp.]
MAVHIRLRRAGAKKAPYYHIIAADSRSRRDGRFLERIGSYRPSTGEVTIDRELLDKWLSTGAAMTDTVKSLVRKHARAAASQAEG